MSSRVRTRHGEVTAELAWSGSGSRSKITPAVGRTVHLPPPTIFLNIKQCNTYIIKTPSKQSSQHENIIRLSCACHKLVMSDSR
ncbi:hypothetical protein Hanom_Chr06g00540871 [Helianthus anomalus]